MRLLLLIAIVLLTQSNIDAQRSIEWSQVYEEGLLASKRENKLMLLQFWSPNSEGCRRIDIEVWPKDTVVSLSERFIPIRIDINVEIDIVSRFRVRSIPSIYIVDPFGNVLETLEGINSNFRINQDGTQNNSITRAGQAGGIIGNDGGGFGIDADVAASSLTLSKVTRLLLRYPSNISLINEAQNHLNNADNKLDGFLRLAEAYQITSSLAKNSGQTSFITESQVYMKRAKKLLKKSKNKRQSQRYQILQITQNIFRKKPEKALKALLDYRSKNDIHQNNESFINTALYLTYVHLKKRSKAETELAALKKSSKNERFLSFIEKIEPKKKDEDQG